MRIIKRLIFMVFLPLFAIAGSGCSPALDENKTETLNIVAATSQIADFVINIADGYINLTSVLEVDSSAHRTDLSAAKRKAIDEADLVIINGLGLDDNVAEIAQNEKLVDLSDIVDDSISTNPHYFNNPIYAIKMVKKITEALLEIDPDNKNTYQANADNYIEKLNKLDNWIFENLNKISPKYLITEHNTFEYFAARYGFDGYFTLTDADDDHAEPSEKDIINIIDIIEEYNINAIFAEIGENEEYLATIAQKTNIKLYNNENGLVGDGLTSDYSTYIEAMRHNISVICNSYDLAATEFNY